MWSVNGFGCFLPILSNYPVISSSSLVYLLPFATCKRGSSLISSYHRTTQWSHGSDGQA